MTSSLHAVEQGGGSKAVVLLHGFGGSHAVWHDVAPSLATGMRVLAYDLPGHGRSLDFPNAGPVKLAATAVLADLAARKIRRFHLVGHSMGGAIATVMAMTEPEKVASLTLIAPGGFGPEINGPLLRRFAAAADRTEVKASLAAMAVPQSPPSDQTVETLVGLRARPGQTRKLIEIADAITRDDRQGVIPRERLDLLDMPVMVVWGTDDPVLPVTQADSLPSHFHLHHVLDAGHMLVEEAPGLVTEAIRRNMKRRRRPSRPRLAVAS